MKKWIALLLTAALCLSLCACGEETVEVTMPAVLFSDQTAEEICADAEERGIESCTVNEDGSVTYQMSESKHEEMKAEMETAVRKSCAALLEGDDAVASFKRMEISEDLAAFDVYVDRAQYTVWDTFSSFVFYIGSAYYQIFAGVPQDEVDVVVQYIDEATGEVLDTGSYRQFLDNAAAE